MGRVVHFDIQTSNPQATIAFYSGLFGWEFQPFGPPDFYWLITTGPEGTPGINGGMVRRRGGGPDKNAPTPVIAFVCTIDVADIDKAGADIAKAGGTLAIAKTTIPGIGWSAYYKDPDGNIFGVYQADKNAK